MPVKEDPLRVVKNSVALGAARFEGHLADVQYCSRRACYDQFSCECFDGTAVDMIPRTLTFRP